MAAFLRCKVAYFYGWTDSEVRNLKWSTFKEYLACIDIIEAQNALTDIRSSSFADFKKPARQKILQQLKFTANTLINKSMGKVKSYEEVMQSLMGRERG